VSRRTYSPLPTWPPAALAGAILIAAYVVGPLVARALIAIDNNNFDYPATD
jgi:hypothetical protein